MKKILFGMLVLSTLVLGAQEGKVNVTAKVVKPLELRVDQHIDFGLLTPGQKNKPHEKEGIVTIIGTPGESFDLKIKTNMTNEYQELGTVIDTYETKMTTGNGGENETMIAKLNIWLEGGDNQIAENHILKEGKHEVRIFGTTTASSTQKEEKYNGDITLRALYR